MYQKIKPKVLFLAAIGFFIAVAVLLIQIDYIVYLAFTNVFHLFGYQSFLVAILLAVFSGCFMFMLLIERYYANMVIRFLYISTAIWMGIFVYFFISSLAYIAGNLFVYIPNSIGILLFLIAVGVSIYGLIHAKKIVVKSIKVSLPGIEEAWKGKKIVCMSDVHLGPIRGAKFAEKITRISNSLSPDVVFIVGDLFDGAHRPDPLKIAKPFENLSSKSGVFFVTGNHEEFRDPSIFLEAVKKLGINVLSDSMILIDGLQIVGVDYLNSSNKKKFKNVLENIKIDKNKPSILLKHEPKNLDVAEDAGISFQVSGHTHDGQQWPFNYITSLMYKGFGYGLKKHGSMLVYVSSGVGGWGPPLRVGSDYEIVCIELV
jgi:hypothetical protein